MARFHTHEYGGTTSVNDAHSHQYSGITSASPDVPGHTHRLFGQTSLNDRHVHEYDLLTGPKAGTNAGHYHFYRGATDWAHGHNHIMEGNTSVYR